MYLDRFVLPDPETEKRLVARRMQKNGGPLPYIDNNYPYGIFSGKELREISFARVTVLYGGNGSGKSTLLNLIARKLELRRTAPGNSGEMFDDYAAACRFETGWDDMGLPESIPEESAIITSDDVFDYMLAARTNNEEIAEAMDDAREAWRDLRFGETVKLRGMEDHEALRMQILARSKSVSRRKFIRRTAGEETPLRSNGETALEYFDARLKNDALYCLDEPENSLSAARQRDLAELLRRAARYCGCQLIIATHSPFLLAMDGARVYDLDACPVDIKDWWELENVRVYADFFRKHWDRFQ